ncbi:hypothetical protein [Paenibacillus endoradicis]|uniref:hypothetical protein n=1 Tax=Paenibacillus endoradicis TaxID=2972487 RepID=UPI00215970BF|nr:hypothetical protein [Paenibacillus endoradicis]MCR8660301.1 hypothetical protein [Paenibacillus endoradicis]
MKQMKGLLLASLITLLISIILYYSMLHIDENSYGQVQVNAGTHMKQVNLSNDNIVDVINDFIDTSHLSKINLNRHVLEVVLFVNNEQTPEQLIYADIPQFVSLAFEKTMNIEQLQVKVMENPLNRNDSVIIFTCNLYRNDAWLEDGSQQLKDVQWLNDPNWVQRLRVKKTIYWQ